jgi:hypothetical protein
VSKDQEKRQTIKMLTLKRKVNRHFMERDDYVSEGSKTQNASLFSFSTNKLPFFCFHNECRKTFHGEMQR